MKKKDMININPYEHLSCKNIKANIKFNVLWAQIDRNARVKDPNSDIQKPLLNDRSYHKMSVLYYINTTMYNTKELVQNGDIMYHIYSSFSSWLDFSSSLMCSKRFLCFHEIRMNVGAAYRV